jgi:hypothetical protein
MHPDQQVYLTYYYFSHCPDCQSPVMKVVHDFGKMVLKEFNSQNLKLTVGLIFCSKCGEGIAEKDSKLRSVAKLTFLSFFVFG